MNVSWAETISCSLPFAHSILLLTVNAVVGVLGSLGNLLVCLAIATNSRLRRSSNYLLFSLAIADLIVTLICEPVVLEFISQLTFFHKCRTSAEELVYHVLVSLSCQTSFFHLVSISVDRFVAVAFPLRHKIFMEKGGLKVMLIASWSLPILTSVLSNIIPTGSTPVFDVIGFVIFSFSGVSIFFFHFLIVVVLLYHRKKTKQLTARTVSVKSVSRLEVRVTCTLAIATGVFTVCWVPIMTLYAIEKWRNTPLHFWLTTVALSNSAMNFLIYSAKMRDFRNAYIGILRKILRL